MLGVSQRLAGVGRDAREAEAAEVVLERYDERWSGQGLSGHLIHTESFHLGREQSGKMEGSA